VDLTDLANERLKCLTALHTNFNFSTSYNVLKVRIKFNNSKTTKNIALFICHSGSKNQPILSFLKKPYYFRNELKYFHKSSQQASIRYSRKPLLCLFQKVL